MKRLKKEENRKNKENYLSHLPKLLHSKSKPTISRFQKSHKRSATGPSETIEETKDACISDLLKQKRINFLLRSSLCEEIKAESFLNKNQTLAFSRAQHWKVLEQKQKKKKKNFNNRETINPLINRFTRDSQKKTIDVEMFEAYFQKKYQMKEMKNFCYDSPFIIPRQGPCLVRVGGKIYLIGGTLRRKIGYIGKQDKNIDIPFHCYCEGQWIREKITEEMPIHYRNIIWHTVNAIGENIAIVGGVMGESQRSMNSLNSDLLLYSPKNKKITKFCLNLPLRFHSSTSFGSYLMVHGGETSEGSISQKMNVINLKEGRSPQHIQYLSGVDRIHHKMVNTLTLQKSDQYALGERGGIYMFGGKNEKGQMDNKMRVIYANCFELQKVYNSKFEDLKISGNSPCSRTHHTLDLIGKKLSLVLVGGLDSRESALADVWLFNLLDGVWSQIQMEPSLELRSGGIWKHSSISDSERVYIYGGKHIFDQGMGNFMCLELGKEMQEKKQSREYEHKHSTFWSISLTNKDISDFMIQP